ncbi:MAG: FHA domain-containing protein [Synechococcus sp.]
MSHITLAWMQAGQRVSRKLQADAPELKGGPIRIGRDPAQCTIVLPSLTDRDRTVSRCHVEITFNPLNYGFYLTNLKANNPAYVGGQLVTGPTMLTQGCTIQLGEIELTVENLASVPETVIVKPPAEQATILRDRVYPVAPLPQPASPMPKTAPQSPPAATPTPPAAEPAQPPPANPPGSVFDVVKDRLFSCPQGHKYTLEEAKDLGWVCKYDGYLITSTFIAK